MPRPKKDPERDRELGANVLFWRKRCGVTQEHLAEFTGVSQQQILKYEKGETSMSAVRIEQIAQVLDLPVQRLFEPPPKKNDMP